MFQHGFARARQPINLAAQNSLRVRCNPAYVNDRVKAISRMMVGKVGRPLPVKAGGPPAVEAGAQTEGAVNCPEYPRLIGSDVLQPLEMAVAPPSIKRVDALAIRTGSSFPACVTCASLNQTPPKPPHLSASQNRC